MSDIDLNRYSEFVDSVMSNKSKNLEEFIAVLRSIDAAGINAPLLITAVAGLAGETGEFCDIAKKLFFQGKPVTDDVKIHLFKELGDIEFYWVTACKALGFNPGEVIAGNQTKLSARYPAGFSAVKSENKASTDL